MSKHGVLLCLTAALVGCNGTTQGDPGQSVPCSFTVAGGPSGQFDCSVVVLFDSLSTELTVEVEYAAPFDTIGISASEPGMPTAPSTWTQADPGAMGDVELIQGSMVWRGGNFAPSPQGSYSFDFSSVSVRASSGGTADYDVHGTWSATTPAYAGSGGNTLNLTGSF